MMASKQWTWEEASDLSPQQVADALNKLEYVKHEMQALVEQWRLEELREREDFPGEARKIGRCKLQLHAIVESV